MFEDVYLYTSISIVIYKNTSLFYIAVVHFKSLNSCALCLAEILFKILIRIHMFILFFSGTNNRIKIFKGGIVCLSPICRVVDIPERGI